MSMAWNELKSQNQQNMAKVLGEMSPEERIIFDRVIKFELENRHLQTPRFRPDVRTIVEQAIRPSGVTDK